MRKIYSLLLLSIFTLQGCSLFAELPEFADEGELDTGIADADEVTDVMDVDLSDADADSTIPPMPTRDIKSR